MRSRAARRRRELATWVAVACLATLAVRVTYVHDKSWEYRLYPSSTPPKVVYRDRDYRRSETAPRVRVEAGLVVRGKTMGGGIIYATAGDLTATVIDVVDGHRVVEYGLMGGP